MEDSELIRRNIIDSKKIKSRERILYERSTAPKSLSNMWRVYDSNHYTGYSGREFSKEHYAFLTKDPVFAAMQHVRNVTIDGSGDPNRRMASIIMGLIRDRKLPEQMYLWLLEAINSGSEKVDLTRYEQKLLR